MTDRPATGRVRKSAAIRRAEIIDAASIEFAENGLAGTRLETIASRADISHPRIVQIFGTKQALFQEVVKSIFDQVLATFNEAARPRSTTESQLTILGEAYRRLLQRNRTVPLMMLQGFAASADPEIREAVGRRYLELQTAVKDLSDADSWQVRTFFATGLVSTVSTALALPGARTDARWGAWLLSLVSDPDTPSPP